MISAAATLHHPLLPHAVCMSIHQGDYISIAPCLICHVCMCCIEEAGSASLKAVICYSVLYDYGHMGRAYA